MNTARSMLSSVLQLNINSSLPVGQLPIVKRFMKGIYELCPSLPRYTAAWDLSTALNYFRKGASVSVPSPDAISKRFCSDGALGGLLRSLFLGAAGHSFWVSATHVPGRLNSISLVRRCSGSARWPPCQSHCYKV